MTDIVSSHHLDENATEKSGVYTPPKKNIIDEAAKFWANEFRCHLFDFYIMQGLPGRHLLKQLDPSCLSRQACYL